MLVRITGRQQLSLRRRTEESLRGYALNSPAWHVYRCLCEKKLLLDATQAEWHQDGLLGALQMYQNNVFDFYTKDEGATTASLDVTKQIALPIVRKIFLHMVWSAVFVVIFQPKQWWSKGSPETVAYLSWVGIHSDTSIMIASLLWRGSPNMCYRETNILQMHAGAMSQREDKKWLRIFERRDLYDQLLVRSHIVISYFTQSLRLSYGLTTFSCMFCEYILFLKTLPPKGLSKVFFEGPYGSRAVKSGDFRSQTSTSFHNPRIHLTLKGLVRCERTSIISKFAQWPLQQLHASSTATLSPLLDKLNFRQVTCLCNSFQRLVPRGDIWGLSQSPLTNQPWATFSYLQLWIPPY